MGEGLCALPRSPQQQPMPSPPPLFPPPQQQHSTSSKITIHQQPPHPPVPAQLLLQLQPQLLPHSIIIPVSSLYGLGGGRRRLPTPYYGHRQKGFPLPAPFIPAGKFSLTFPESVSIMVHAESAPVLRPGGKGIRVWRSLVSRLVRVQETVGSNPATRTIGVSSFWMLRFFLSPAPFP